MVQDLTPVGVELVGGPVAGVPVPGLLEPQCVSLLETKKTRWGGVAGAQVAG